MTASGLAPVIGADRAPVTVIVGQRVAAGREEDFRAWQEELNRTVAGFAGFLGTELMPPADPGGEWTVIYRFDSRENWDTWMASLDRVALLERGDPLFAGEATQRVLVGEPRDEGLTVVVSHTVESRWEDEFVAWQEQVDLAQRAFAGFRGSETFRPVPGASEEWTTIFRFDTEDHLNAWLDSSERGRLLDSGRRFEDFELRRIPTPFGAWFSFTGPGGEAAPPPPNWKSALSVLVGLYPTVVLLTLAISELWPKGALWETLLLGNILSVSLLTWVVMPVVTRALRFWLDPDPGRAGPRVDRLGAAASVGFLTVAAVVFWAVTTQIWTLP